MKNKIDISIVIPVYQGQETIKVLLNRIYSIFEYLSLTYEVILVDDGSSDNSWVVIEKEITRFDLVTALKFSRNYGQHNAISGGLHCSNGEWVVVMDCDLQDQPEEILKLYNKAIEGYDIVVGQRIKRSDSAFKIWTSKLFHKMFSVFTGIKLEIGIGNFGIYNKRVIDAVIEYKENFRPFPIIVKTLGYSRVAVEVAHSKRLKGKSNYNGFNLLKGAVNTILYYSHKPIWIFLIGGLGVVAFVSFLLVGVLFLTFDISILQLIIILIILMSFVSLNVAIIGVYVSRIFLEIKNRPAYVIDKQICIN